MRKLIRLAVAAVTGALLLLAAAAEAGSSGGIGHVAASDCQSDGVYIAGVD
jgi:hypothetical protein